LIWAYVFTLSAFWAVKSLIVPEGPHFILRGVSNLSAAIAAASRRVNAVDVDGFDVLRGHGGKCSLTVAKRTGSGLDKTWRKMAQSF
jgi:hypothetical protein